MIMSRVVRKSLQMVFILSVVSCGVSEMGNYVKDEVNGVWTGPSSESSTVFNNTTYVTAFDYADDYDWWYNPEKGSVRCSLVVYTNGKPTLKVPVGDMYHVSDDPDMHRMIDGHLYTDYATDTETIIKKDGKPYVSFEGRESILAMAVHADSLYTLGQKRNGKGFTYRVNGRVILEKNNAYSFGKLVSVNGSICFAFAEQIETASDALERYYYFKDGVVFQTALREDLKRVWDVVFHQGKVHLLTSLSGISDPIVISESGMYALSLPSGASVISGRLISAGNHLAAEMVLSAKNGISSALWLDNKLYTVFGIGKTVSSIWVGDDGIACVLNGKTAMEDCIIFRMGEFYELPNGLSCQGMEPMDMINGILTVGLSSMNGSKPVMWRDGEIEELDVNGYICTVSTLNQSSQRSVLD